MPKKKTDEQAGYDTSRAELVKREIVCASCGALLFVMVPSDAVGADSCECAQCRSQIGFSYDFVDPMVGSPTGDEDIPF